jgi:uncharacterized short protein YbdD (DUF466 family)
MTNGRKGPIEQSVFRDNEQFKVYDGTGKAAGMPAYDELLADTELYWGLGEYDSPKEDRTADKTKRPAKEFPTEHQDLFIRLAEHVGTDVLYNWLHQPHKLSMAGLKPGVKPKALPVDCRLPYFDDNKKLVGTDQFAEYLDHLAMGGEWPDAPRLTASYINFMTERAQAKQAKETKVEKAPEPPPKPGPPKPIEGPKPPPLPTEPPPPLGPHGSVPTAVVYGHRIDISVPKNIRPTDVALPDKPGYHMKIWSSDDYERIIEDLDNIHSRIAEGIGVADDVLHGIPANLEIKAIASYLQSIIEREEENKPAPIKQKKSKKPQKPPAPETEESEEMKSIRYAARVLGRYTSNEDIHFTPEELQLFTEAMNGVCLSVDDLYEHYKSQAMEFAKGIASRHFQKKQYTYFGKMVQNTDYTDDLLADIQDAFDDPKDAELVFTDIRKAKFVSRRGKKADYEHVDPHEYFLGLEQLEKLQGMLNVPADQVDPRNQTFPAHVRELANKLVTWADMKFFIRALEEGNVKPFEDMTKELKNRRKGVPKVCAGLVYNAEEGVTADSELLLIDIDGRPESISISNYVESAADDEQGAKVMERRLTNAFEALLMVGEEIADERMEKVEPESQDGPLPPPPIYLGQPSPPPGPPEPRYGPKPGPPLPSPYQLALPGPPQKDGENEADFTEVDELEDGSDEKGSKTSADAQDKDLEYECPTCGANVMEDDKKCPECGVNFEHNEEGEE